MNKWNNYKKGMKNMKNLLQWKGISKNIRKECIALLYERGK